MTALIGRERELATALRVVTTSESTPVARTLTIEGSSGVGKTALLAAIKDASPDWVHVSTAAHRIQSSLSNAVVRRLLVGLNDALGERAERYRAGLGEIRETKDPSHTLLRLLEGVTLDHPVFISIDDVQWIDEDSAQALTSIIASLADRPLVLASTQRSDGERTSSVPSDEWIPLAALGDRAAAAVARAHYPNGNDDVISAIVAQSAGQPIDLVSLAQSAREREATTSEHVAESMRTVAVRNIQALPAQLREFLQVMSLLNEPIDYSLLRRMWPNDKQLTELIAAASERFLIQDGTHLRFAHALLADAVLETIPVKIPLRRRIVDALATAPTLSIEDRLQIAEQAQACGDRDLAMKTLIELARDATDRGQVRLTIDVIEQLLAIAEPPDDEFVAIYSAYGRALQFIDRTDRSIQVFQDALDEARRRGISGTAPIAAQLVIAQCFSDQRDSANATYERLAKDFREPLDRAHLNAAAMWLAVCDADVKRLQVPLEEIEALEVPIPAELSLRCEIARAFMAVRTGEFEAARTSAARIVEAARGVPDALRNLGDFASTVVDFNLLGVRDSRIAELHKRFNDSENGSFMDYFYASSEFYTGRYSNAALIVASGLERYTDPLHRRRMLSLAAGLSAVHAPDPTLDRAIESDLARLLTGERGGWFIKLASWCTLLPTISDSRARILSRIVLDNLAHPDDPYILTHATPIAVSARERGDTELLELIVEPNALWNDRTPIVHADFELARAIAKNSGITEAIERCRNLGLNVFEQLAARVSAKTLASKTEAKSPLTARERQIADLIAAGKTNREIAEGLVLSERTVEGHIANIFNKLNVSSRTQIAAWFIKSA